MTVDRIFGRVYV